MTITVVKIPHDVSLLETGAAPFLASLTKLGEELHRSSDRAIRGVVVLQEAPADDRSAAWRNELAESLLLKDLAATIYGWRWLLSLVRNSPVPWLYASASDTLGSAFELALSCQRRYWFDPRARVGFPEIAAGAFPPGGALESLSKRSGRTQDRWYAKPTSTASEAFQGGLVHFAAACRDWTSAAQAMFGELLADNPRAGVRDAGTKRRRLDAGMLELDPATPAVTLEALDGRERKKGEKPQAPSAWDACWELAKARNRFHNAQELGWAIAHVAGRHLLSPAFLRSLETRAHEPCITAVARGDLPPIVAVDLDHLTPPTESLLKLAQGGLRVVLAASEAEPLATAMNLVYARLDRQIGAQDAHEIWRQSFVWCQADPESLGLPVLRWTIDDRLVVTDGTRRVEYLRLEGNAGSAGAGALEVLQAGASALQTLAAVTAEAIVGEAGGAGVLPRSLLIRSCALEELVRICRHCDGDLSVVTQHLASAGWRFAGSDEAWDRFLKSRLDAFGPDALPQGFDRPVWDLGAWKHAKAVAKKLAGAGKEARWNATQTSQHMATFAGLLADAMGGKEADLLVFLALGFPESYGSPVGFLRRRGGRRTRHYVERHWPHGRFTGNAPWQTSSHG